MAKSSHKLDEVFKEKLDQHSIKPSALAWERLERKLPKETKSYKGYWWAAAASVVILLSAGYFLYPVITPNPGETMLATNQEIIIPEEKEETISTIPESKELEEIDNQEQKKTENPSNPALVQEKPKQETTKEKPSKIQPLITEEAPKNLIAMTETRDEKVEVTQVIIPEEKLETKPLVEPSMELPTLNLNNAVAENTSTTVEEPAYRIKIFSDGLKEEPKDKSLIAGIGKTVNEVGGLLGKVDQGFADLQDAKNNLFTNLTSKKEQADK